MTADRYASRRFDAHDESHIDTDILETLPFAGVRGQVVVYETDEFTSVCPWTGLPDFGRVAIEYVPADSLVELKSLKYYLLSFRNVGILQEHAVARILRDLSTLLKPRYMKVTGNWNNRGGLRTDTWAEYRNEA